MSDPVADRIRPWLDELTAIRRDIHANPELGMEEARTAALVAGRLRAWGLEVTEGIGKHGIVATVKGNRPGNRTIGLRADMDALEIAETTGLPHASANGRMHACGHDGHTTMLLGAARYLQESRDFAGTVHLIFQPAEEGRGGAVAMLQDGLFERFPCDAVYGLHNMPGLPVGSFAIRKGPLLAAAGRWDVVFEGRGGHGGAAPHVTSDLTVVQAHFVLGLQTVVGRNVPPIEPAVISVGFIHGGSHESANVMPSRLVVGGTMRAFSRSVQAIIDGRLTELAESLARMHGCTASVKLHWGTTPLVNHAEQTDVAVAAAAATSSAAEVESDTAPLTGGEDFAYMLDKKPGAFIFMGNGDTAALHTPKYDFNDAALPVGIGYWASLVQAELGAQE